MCESIVNVSKLGNKYIDTQAPWTLRKTDTVRMRTVLYVLVETLRMTAIMLSPVMPTSCGNMLDQLGMKHGVFICIFHCYISISLLIFCPYFHKVIFI